MRTLIHEHRTRVADADGRTYTARTYAEERNDGTWYAWLEFEPTGFGRLTLHTDQETSQPNQSAVTYWATGLEPIYLEGALSRAHV
jgi:hypothetical protein